MCFLHDLLILQFFNCALKRLFVCVECRNNSCDAIYNVFVVGNYEMFLFTFNYWTWWVYSADRIFFFILYRLFFKQIGSLISLDKHFGANLVHYVSTKSYSSPHNKHVVLTSQAYSSDVIPFIVCLHWPRQRQFVYYHSQLHYNGFFSFLLSPSYYPFGAARCSRQERHVSARRRI